MDKGFQGGKVRVLLSLPVLEGHDRGIKYIARKLMEAGMEVIYTAHHLIEEVADTAIAEGVDVIGLSSHVGSHTIFVHDLVELLKRKGAGDKVVIVGGLIPHADIPVLHEAGVRGIFNPGTDPEEIISFITQAVQKA